MPREFPRSRRIEEAIQRILSEALAGKVRDPRLAGLTITEVSISRDLSVARVYYTTLAASSVEGPEIDSALEAASGFFRSTLARQLRVRKIPELRFSRDQAMERARALERLITAAVGEPGGEQERPASDDSSGSGDGND